MNKALFKKQMMEIFSWVYQDKKSGKNRSKSGVIGYIVLYLVLFVFLGVMFFTVAAALCEPLVQAGLGWLYFALMGLIAVALGVFGSVFNTYAGLYQAKDNDLLLAMPIPPARILTVRLSGVFAMGLMYELIVMIPALIVWFATAPVTLFGVVFSLLIPLLLAVLILVLSAILGWVIALVSSRLGGKSIKSILTVCLSLVFIAVYYYCYARAYSILQSILADPKALGDRIRSILFPFYHMGLAAEGNPLSMLIFTLVAMALFGIVYLVLSCSFLKLATTNRGAPKAIYKQRRTSERTVDQALLGKEWRRFLNSSGYMLNCGLGVVIMVIAAVALLIKQSAVREMLLAVFPGGESLICLLAAAAVCLLCTMNNITAPSVSLEGKNLWLLQAFPVPAKKVLTAKLRLHLILTLIPAAVLLAAVEWVLKPPVGLAVMLPVTVAAFVLWSAAFGLFLNLKMPNLSWTSEIVPIKQSMSVMVALFGGWAAIMLLALLYWAVSSFMSPLVFLICIAGFLLAAAALLLRWIWTKGAQIWDTL